MAAPSAKQAEGILEKLAGGIDMKDAPRLINEFMEKRTSIERSLQKDRSMVKNVLHRIQLLIEMFRNKEFKVDIKAKALILAGILYFVLPFDLTFDYIPFLGYVDDSLVIAAVFRMLSGEIERYEQFRRGKFEREGKLDQRPVADNKNTTTAITGATA